MTPLSKTDESSSMHLISLLSWYNIYTDLDFLPRRKESITNKIAPKWRCWVSQESLQSRRLLWTLPWLWEIQNEHTPEDKNIRTIVWPSVQWIDKAGLHSRVSIISRSRPQNPIAIQKNVQHKRITREWSQIPWVSEFSIEKHLTRFQFLWMFIQVLLAKVMCCPGRQTEAHDLRDSNSEKWHPDDDHDRD
jgi:hypothetical protein